MKRDFDWKVLIFRIAMSVFGLAIYFAIWQAFGDPRDFAFRSIGKGLAALCLLRCVGLLDR